MPNPGSFNEFTTDNGLGPETDAVKLYGEALSKYRVELADQKGLTLDELHELPTVAGWVVLKDTITD